MSVVTEVRPKTRSAFIARIRRATRRPWFLVAVVALAFGVGAWWSPIQRTQPVPPAAAPPIALSGSGRYVALGDSYAAGEGLAPYITGTQDTSQGGDRCHRSAHASYPLDVTFAPPQPSSVDLMACSGAIVANVYDEVQYHGTVPDGQGLQVSANHPLGNDVRLITLTMGGNDLHFANALVTCGMPGNCLNKPYGGARTLSDWMSAHLVTLQGELLTLYMRLHHDAPNARIVVLDYPALFPEEASSFIHVGAECSALFAAGFLPPERGAIRQWGLELDAIIQQEASAAGIDSVDVYPYFVGHEPCGANGAWLHFTPLSDLAGAFHPTPRGQQEMARILACYLYLNPTTPTSPASQRDHFAMDGCVS